MIWKLNKGICVFAKNGDFVTFDLGVMLLCGLPFHPQIIFWDGSPIKRLEIVTNILVHKRKCTSLFGGLLKIIQFPIIWWVKHLKILSEGEMASHRVTWPPNQKSQNHTFLQKLKYFRGVISLKLN